MRDYEAEVAKKYKRSEEEIVGYRAAVDAYLAAWGVAKSSKNRRVVLEGAFAAYGHMETVITHPGE